MADQNSSFEEHPASVGRYLLQHPIARGGMATVHAARLIAAEGVSRLVAAKRLHPQYVDDPEFVTMFHDEARIASQIHHPNVVPVLDVVRDLDEVILVQEYVHGVPLSYLMKHAIHARTPIALPIALTVISGMLSGLHAAHEAKDELGEPLGIVHRDVSPQNVLVTVDGIPRLVDFGIAKAKTSEHHTREGFFKGKLSYMAPEQLKGDGVDRAADIYAAGVLLWELVVNRRFHDRMTDPDFVRAVVGGATLTPTAALAAERSRMPNERWAMIQRLEPIVVRSMALAPGARYRTAADMVAALAAVTPHASASEVADWVRSVGAEFLEHRQQLLVAPEEGGTLVIDTTRSEGERSSGPRIRVDASERMVTVPTPPNSLTPEALSGPWPAHRTSTLRSSAPWVLSAGLLVVIGVLAGMTLPREPAVAARAQVEMREPTFEREHEPPPPASVEPAQAPVATRPSASAAPRASAPPPRSTWSAPARTTPMWSPTPTISKDCNPPFYFDGTKKVFKPNCI